jgi:hypothetical protein
MSCGWWSLTWAAQNRVKYLQSTAGCHVGDGLSGGLHRIGLSIYSGMHRIGLSIYRGLQDITWVVVSHVGCTE